MPTPWVAYGQTAIGAGLMHLDPHPNKGPVVGAITAWPYVVPAGYNLTITGYGVEGNATGNTIFPILGPLPAGAIIGDSAYAPWWNQIAAAALYSVAGTHSKAEFGFQFQLPAGTEVHVGIINSSPYNLVHGWFLQGELRPTSTC